MEFNEDFTIAKSSEELKLSDLPKQEFLKEIFYQLYLEAAHKVSQLQLMRRQRIYHISNNGHLDLQNDPSMFDKYIDAASKEFELAISNVRPKEN